MGVKQCMCPFDMPCDCGYNHDLSKQRKVRRGMSKTAFNEQTFMFWFNEFSETHNIDYNCTIKEIYESFISTFPTPQDKKEVPSVHDIWVQIRVLKSGDRKPTDEQLAEHLHKFLTNASGEKGK